MKARETKAKMNYWGFIKIKNLLHSEGNKTKRQPTEWENTFVNDVSDKGQVSKIYKELIKLNTQETNNPVMKWTEDMNRHFSKEDLHMVNEHMKKCSTYWPSGKYKSKPQ